MKDFILKLPYPPKTPLFFIEEYEDGYLHVAESRNWYYRIGDPNSVLIVNNYHTYDARDPRISSERVIVMQVLEEIKTRRKKQED